MFRDWLAGDTSIKRAKAQKIHSCLDCPAQISYKGGAKRCPPCSSAYRQAENLVYRRRKSAEKLDIAAKWREAHQ